MSDVYPSDRTYTVRFGECWSLVEYDGPPPTPGTLGTYLVTRHLEWTRRILLKPLS
ncbi:hypothetical protein [Actinoplanes sp. NPDC051494]|uniref:hypothetical protein n=1 Tax=Actinoplanes sp. NPDC051494 TaxID=3363907 RepID=UPI003793F2C4